MNYYELIYLLEDFKTKFQKFWIQQAVTPFKNQLELFIENDEKSFRLILNVTPGNTALFIDSFRPPKKSNTQHFFAEIYGVPIKDIVLEVNERLISFIIEDGSRLWFKLYGSKANALLSRDGIIRETFKDRDAVGDQEPSAKQIVLFDESELDQLKYDQALQKVLPLLPKAWIITLSAFYSFEMMSAKELIGFAKKIDAELRNSASFRILEDGNITAIPESILPIKTTSFFESVNEYIQYRFKNFAHQQRLHQLKGDFQKSLSRQIKRVESALKNLCKADKGLEKADIYEKYAHILMANAHLTVTREKVIVLDDLYSFGEKISIPLDEKISLVENAQRYYSKSANSLKSYEQALERIPILEEKGQLFKSLLIELQSIDTMATLKNWQKEHRNELLSLIQNSSKDEKTVNEFYTVEHKGYVLWIGKNARSNDKIVQKSHKEDIWLHARGISGSHVIIRMNNSKEMPDKRVIEEVAQFAAYQSKAKGARLAPVIYTKRKYIRKPKGSAYGAVIVQKEQVVIIEPKNPFQ